MERAVATRLAFKTAAETKVALAVAVARNAGYGSLKESLTVTAGGEDLPVTELSDHHGGRFHYMEFAEPTEVLVEYSATVTGLALPEEPGLMELIRYVRPSRYAESDRLLPTAYAEFGGLQGEELLHAVRNWVFSELRYVSGSSRGTDGAVETLLHRRGVCRDFAHLAIALLRSKNVPARLAAVYAPGLSSDGLPRGGRSAHQRRLAHHRSHGAGTAGEHAADHGRAGFRGHRLPVHRGRQPVPAGTQRHRGCR